MKNKTFENIGIVLGETHINGYDFMLRSFKAKKNDMVTTETSIPDGNGRVIKVNVWGKIASINCSNGWFPRQVAQEMALQKINIEDTPLPDSQNELICKVNILGYTKKNSESQKLLPMVYPVKPASSVSYPSSADVEKLLVSDLNSKHPIHIGTLLARDNVNINIDADNLVSRHVLITGMSGSGKTVGVRRIIAELMKLHFPMLVYDMHGDYLGFVKKQNLFPNNKIKLFYPSLSVKAEDKEIIYTLINKLGKPLTEPQNDYLNTLLNKVKFDESLFDDNTVKFINGSFFKPMGHSAAHLIREYVKPRVNMRRNEEGNREYSFSDFDWKFVSGTASQFIDTGLLEKHIIECTQPFFNTQYRDPYLLSMRDALLNQYGTLFGSQDLLETYVEKHKAICEENIKKYGQKFFWI